MHGGDRSGGEPFYRSIGGDDRDAGGIIRKWTALYFVLVLFFHKNGEKQANDFACLC